MARFHGPIKKRKKRLGLDESIIGARRKLSDFGVRLKEKQKAKFLYGILEKQFKKYFEKAAKNRKNTELILIQSLERRLDNVVFRLRLAKTRAQARQLVNHGHILVNGERVNIPSYQITTGETVTLGSQFAENPLFREIFSSKEEAGIPAWLTKEGLTGKIERLPERNEGEPGVDTKLIIEYYSR